MGGPAVPPAGLIFFFKHGPFAWNGLLAWWLILVSYSAWILVNTIVLIGAIRRQVPEPDDVQWLAAELEPFRREFEGWRG